MCLKYQNRILLANLMRKTLNSIEKICFLRSFDRRDTNIEIECVDLQRINKLLISILYFRVLAKRLKSTTVMQPDIMLDKVYVAKFVLCLMKVRIDFKGMKILS